MKTGGSVVTRSLSYLLALGSVLVLLGSVGLGAQVSGPDDAGSQPENPAKVQAFRFEGMLRNAIDLAGQRLAQQARKVAPDLTLHVSEPAVARGVRLANYGFYFDVQAPDITSSMIVWDMQRGRPQPVQPMTPVRDRADGVAPGTLPIAFDPDQAYTTYVREALIDSILDESSMLQLAAGEFLTVAVSGIEQPMLNQLYRFNSAKLIITIRGSDLIDFRQGRLSREQAKERLAQERF